MFRRKWVLNKRIICVSDLISHLAKNTTVKGKEPNIRVACKGKELRLNVQLLGTGNDLE